MITQEKLKEILKYKDGQMYWVKDSQGRRLDKAAGTSNKGYIKICIDGKIYSRARLTWLYHHGKFPDNQIDHINRIRDDDRIENLRDVTQTENRNHRLPLAYSAYK